MEVEGGFRTEEIEPRGALCVECLRALTEPEALADRCGAALCGACAAEFYVPCAGCGGLVARDEGRARADVAGALFCAECFRAPAPQAGVGPLPGDEETEALVARYVALHAEKKRVDAEIDEVKERLKLVAGARARVAGAVLLRAGDSGVRCSYSVRTTWDAERLSAAEALLGGEEFAALFERKVTFTPLRERLDDFLAGADEELSAARELVRAAAHVSETATLNVITPKKKKNRADDA